MAFPERMRWLGRTALLVFILGAVAFLSALTAIRFAVQGREVDVPTMVGMKAGDAQAKLAGLGLGFRIADRVYSDQPADYVVRQSPPPGTRVKVPQRVHVVLSLGPRKVPIPLLEGRSLRVARIEILRAGLQIGAVASTHLPTPDSDVVIRQYPLPGEKSAASPRVDLLVSLGAPEETFLMPDFVGVPVLDAQRRISNAGLRLARITFVPVPAALHGAVVQQIPARGSRIRAGAAIQLQVAE